jgi:hypothetical protein
MKKKNNNNSKTVRFFSNAEGHSSYTKSLLLNIPLRASGEGGLYLLTGDHTANS